MKAAGILAGLVKSRRAALALECGLVFVLAAALIWPLFKLKYMDNWASIEATFISDARMLKENLPHPGWQPYWYCGTRWDYVYPPALRYGTALLSAAVKNMVPARAYHLYTAIFYALGMVGVYLLVRVGSQSRRAAWFSAAAVATLSPIFLFAKDIRVDARVAHSLPQRLNALLRYGEGPHMSALAVLGFALALAWLALPARRPAMLALASAACALVVSNNFYGATALACFYPFLVWALWLAHKDRRILYRAAAIPLLAWGLTAIWLTPSFVHITTRNLKLVSRPGNLWSWIVLALFAAVFAALTWRWARGKQQRAWAVFLVGAASFIWLFVLGERFVNFRVFGEPGRMCPEFDLLTLIGAIEVLRRLWPKPAGKAVVSMAALAAVYFAWPYLRHAHSRDLYPKDDQPQARVEYEITEWIRRHYPESRALTSGSVRFWYNAWFDGAQIGGGSEQGLLNESVMPAQWELTAGESPELARYWLLATGADLAIVHDKTSREIYHDFAAPEKFEGLPVVYDNKRGDKIYRIPRRYPGLARVVDMKLAEIIPPAGLTWDPEALRAYVNLIENGPRQPALWRRIDFRTMRVATVVAPGQAIVVMESYDPYWRAWSQGIRLKTRRDPMGFLLIEAPAGRHDILIRFETPLENRIGAAVTLLSLAAVLYLLWIARKPRN